MKKYFKDEAIRKQIFIYTLSGIFVAVAVCIILNIDGIVGIINSFINVISPFLWGIFFAFITIKFAILIESKFPEKLSFKIKRVASSIISILSFLLIIVVVVSIIIPQLAESIGKLSNTVVSFSSTPSDWIDSLTKDNALSKQVAEGIYEYSNTLVSGMWNIIKTSIPSIVGATITTVKSVLNFTIGFIVALYILIDRERIYISTKRFCKAFLKEEVYSELKVIYRVSISKFYKFFKGKLLDSLIIGILCFIIMTILGLDFTLLISVIVGLTNIIPFFGPFIGAIPSALILLMVEPSECLIFLIMILVLQQVDGNIIGPKILGDSMGLSSLWIMFAIIVGGAYFGFFGMLLGVPVFSVIYYLVSKKIDKRLNDNKTA